MRDTEELKSAYWGVGHFALEADGYRIDKIVFPNKPKGESCWDQVFRDFDKYLYIGRDQLLLRAALFALQRFFGKWGGEQTPESHRDFSLYYLLYLATYRYELPAPFKGHFFKDDDYTTIEEREQLASVVRRQFMSGYRSPIASFEAEARAFLTANHTKIISKLDTKYRNRPEIILAMSINIPRLAASLYMPDSTYILPGGIKNVKEHLDIVYKIEKHMYNLCSTRMISADDHINALAFFFLETRLIRNPNLVSDGSVEYSMLMFLYLELYRKELLSCFTVEPFASQWQALPKNAKEDTAELFRKRLSLARETFKKQEEEEYAIACKKKALLDSFRGMFWGLVVGDCLGSPIQFSEKDQHPRITEMVDCPVFNTPPGYWTDDSSMAFCVADSVVRRGGYDLQDIANTFVRWYREGFWSSLPHAFDVGHATQEAIYAIENGNLSNGFEESQGNGSIMRLAPSYILNYGNPDHTIMHEVSDLTHNSEKVRETVNLMAAVLDEHMQGNRTSVKSIYETRDEVDNSGWAVSTLQAALWAFQTTKTFEDGMIAAVNLGGDSDTIGAVYGQIAGAYYGFDDIPERWLNAIKDREKVYELIESFLKVAAT